MSENLLELTERQLGTSGFDALKDQLGLPEEKKEAAVSTGVATVLAGMLNKGESKTGLNNLYNLATDSTAVDPGALPETLGDRAQFTSVQEAGGNLAEAIFGPRAGDVGQLVAKSLEIDGDRGTSLLKILAAVVTAVVGRQVKGKGMDPGGLAKLLYAQKPHIKGKLPDGLLKSLGVHDFDDLGQHLESHGHSEPQTARPKKAKVDRQRSAFAKWFWPLLIALAVLYALNMCSKKEQMEESPGEGVLDEEIITDEPGSGRAGDREPQATGPNAAGTERGAQQGDATVGDMTENMGSEEVLDFGVLMQQYIDDSARDPNREFRLPIEFKEDTAELVSGAEAEVQALATILNRNPELEIVIEGHTTGNGDENRKKALSQQRADTVRQMLLEKGIGEGRITAMGMGSTKPLADANSESGMRQNQRIVVKIVKFE
ncbi:OmpA family protein [Microbulbifer yueqingensis]|uniref:Outer membrane protein OmpA n=1 Tax=Microbulbifer yueqingensis TaxID=658219 RepID=A0A1G8YG08_9GAMM|nr:OmpA family protein [Microbulbifer yueqingensis]SDK01758.1 Outer membrane protein OmpA [Microbulbifer yueqingensis]